MIKALGIVCIFISINSFAKELVCESKDLSFKIERSKRESSVHSDTTYSERSKLTVTCNDKEFILLAGTPSRNWTPAVSGRPVSEGDFNRAVRQRLSLAEDEHQRDTMKSFLATLLMAKTNGMKVGILHDPESGLNYSNSRNTILGLSIK